MSRSAEALRIAAVEAAMPRTTLLLLSFVALAGMPAAARAQTIAAAAELSPWLRTGGTLGATELGWLNAGAPVDFSPSALGRSVDAQRQDVDPGVTRGERGRRSRKGALIGLLVGAVALPTIYGIRTEMVCGPYRGTIHACDDEWSLGTTIVVCGSVGAVVGAAVGAAIGARLTHRDPVFGNQRLRSRLSMGTFMNGRSMGLRQSSEVVTMTTCQRMSSAHVS